MNDSLGTRRGEYPYLYILRGAATLLVILLHCIMEFLTDASLFGGRAWWLCNVINSFVRAGVPLFFMMSGFLLLSDARALDVGAFYKKRLPRILVPLLFWNIVYYIYIAVGQGSWSVRELVDYILNCGSGYHLWFVYTLFGLYLLTPFVKRVVDACTAGQLWIFLGICAFAGTIRPLFNTVTPLYLYLFDPLSNGYLAYMLLGYILGKTDFGKKTRLVIYLLGLAGVFLGIYGNWASSSPEAVALSANGGYSINHFMVAAALFTLAKSLPAIKNARVLAALRGYSNATYGIYLIHVLALGLASEFIPLEASPTVLIAFRFAFTAVASSIIMLPLSRVKIVNKLIM